MNEFSARSKGQPLQDNDTVQIRFSSNLVTGEIYECGTDRWYLITELTGDDVAVDYRRPELQTEPQTEPQTVTASKSIGQWFAEKPKTKATTVNYITRTE